jgi:hypothetical protein
LELAIVVTSACARHASQFEQQSIRGAEMFRQGQRHRVRAANAVYQHNSVITISPGLRLPQRFI